MKSYSSQDIRVVGFFGHRGSGKTSLAEAFLFNGKVTSRLGSVDSGNLTLESDPNALERQTTMQANVGFVEWNGSRINMIDTPGDGNFWGATMRALAVVDAGVVTVAAPDGMEPITTRCVTTLNERGTPYVLFVTKLDKEGADFDSTIAEAKADIGKDTVALTLPIGSGDEFKGVISLLSQKAYLADGDKTKEADVPADMTDAVESAREALFDAVAAADDVLMEKYLEEGTLTDEELSQGLKAAFLKGDVVPVFAGNPTVNLGSRVLMDAISSFFPSPLDRPAIKGYKTSDKTDPVERAPSADGPVVAQVFRTHYDAFAGMLSYARVWTGTIAGGDLYNSTKDSNDRPSHLYLPQGGTKNGEEVKQAVPGDLIALTKLKHTATGDTLTSKDDPTFLAPFVEPDALLNVGINANDKKFDDKLSQGIAKMVEEDPSLRYERDSETKEMLLGGLGQAHIDHVVDKLKRSGIEVTLREPKVPYRETLRGPVMEIEGKHKKQSGGSGQFGVCLINVEPQPRGAGLEFVDKIVGGSIPRQYIASVEKGVRDALVAGPISGNEVVDLKITLYDGKYHRVDSSDVAFQTAGRKAIKAVFDSPRAKPILLEPYMELDIVCPAETVGDVMGDLNSRRARVNNMTTEGRRGKISASVPMNEVLRYTNVLKSVTSGRGSFTMRFDRYEEAPSDVQQQVASQHKGADSDD